MLLVQSRMNMSRYMSLTLCALIAILRSASGDGQFIKPSAPGEVGDFSEDLVFVDGQSQTFSFQLGEDHPDGISIVLWQEQGDGPENPYKLASMLNLPLLCGSARSLLNQQPKPLTS